MCGATIKCVSLLVLVFEQRAVQANNSTPLCVTIVGVNRIFNCGRVGKLVSVESKHFKNAFGLRYIHRRPDDVNRKKKVNNISNKIPIFEQGVVPANNSTTLCVTIVGVNRIFNCEHVEKSHLWAWRANI